MVKVSLRAYNRDIEAMIDNGQLDEAIAHCQHILKTFPKHLETYRLLGKSYLEAKRYNEAVDIFSRVLVAEPSDFVAQVGMSIIRDEQDKLDDAIWHMERAFETQPSNAAIQGELQRLYGRRDGSQPPRIRMTRGALAHMYMQGELYPQAISETKNVLEVDHGRSDMQALLAKAYFKSGHKNDAADTASAVLKRYPFCLDANRVLTEILSVDHPESAEVYRKRVYELDPYAAQVDGSVFQSNDVSDAAVSLERLDWKGESTGLPSDWGSKSAISLESGPSDEQPDWLKSTLPETTSSLPTVPAFVSEEESMPSTDTSTPEPPEDDIPDFLRAAGWGKSTGVFDESKSSTMFEDEPASEAQPLEQGDMPDWIKAMAPREASEPEIEEEIPDWINKIGTGELPIPSTSPPSDDQPDWLKGTGGDETPAPQSVNQNDQLDQIGGEGESFPISESLEDSALINSLSGDEPGQPEPSIASSEKSPTAPDTGNLGMGEQEQDDSFAWLENLAVKQGATEGLLTRPEERLEDEPEWIKQAKGMSDVVVQSPGQDEKPVAPEPTSANVEELGKSEEERDDSFAWLENLAVKQGATEGLLTRPEERLEDEPDWVKQAKSSSTKMQQPKKEEEIVSEEPERAQDDMERMEHDKEIGEKFSDESMSMPEKDFDETTETVDAVDDVSSWLERLDDKEEPPQQAAPTMEVDDTEAWLKTLDEPGEGSIDMETVVPENEILESSDELPSWLDDLDKEETKGPAFPESDDLPAWLRDETGELVAEPTKIEPTHPTDWMSAEHKEAEATPPPTVEVPSPTSKSEPVSVSDSESKSEPAPEPAKKSEPKKKKAKPAPTHEPYKEPVTRKTTGMLEMPIDPILGSARTELTRSNIPGALETYGKLIKKGRFLEEVIYDLRDALYRYPVEVSIWQSLGDAYMRANQLQDALDAYTKAEELLR